MTNYVNKGGFNLRAERQLASSTWSGIIVNRCGRFELLLPLLAKYADACNLEAYRIGNLDVANSDDANNRGPPHGIAGATGNSAPPNPPLSVEPAAPASDKAAGGKTHPVGVQIRSALRWAGPYKELILGLSGLVVTVGGAAVWVISYFATQAALSNLECKITHHMSSSRFEARATALSAQMDALESRSAQLEKAAKAAKKADPYISTLLTEIRNLQKQSEQEREKATRAMADAANCPK